MQWKKFCEWLDENAAYQNTEATRNYSSIVSSHFHLDTWTTITISGKQKHTYRVFSNDECIFTTKSMKQLVNYYEERKNNE